MSAPASAFGNAAMFTLSEIGDDEQPRESVANTVIRPMPGAPQSMVTVLVPCPLAIVPPVTPQV